MGSRKRNGFGFWASNSVCHSEPRFHEIITDCEFWRSSFLDCGSRAAKGIAPVRALPIACSNAREHAKDIANMRAHELTGQRFTRLAVIARAGSSKHGFSLWDCICGCGTKVRTTAGELLNGGSKSCGCLRSDRSRERAFQRAKHGHCKNRVETRTYRSWRAMIVRCTNPKQKNWEAYGGRGIAVCERWRGDRGFQNFLSDMGMRPEGQTLERVNVDGNYQPSNCRWATYSEQRRNQRPTAA
jgi:hypothetical protein